MLNKSVSNLENDFVSGARQMADAALASLGDLIEPAAETAKSTGELWEMSVYAAKALVGARPSMSAAINACLLRALDDIKKLWEIEETSEHQDLKRTSAIAKRMINDMLEERKATGLRLSDNFVEWIRDCSRQVGPSRGIPSRLPHN